MARFGGKTVLITGGASGIGLATAKRIASECGRLILTGTRETHLDAARDALPDAIVVRNDSGDPDTGRNLAETIRTEADGHIDCLFLNAGTGVFSPMKKVDADFVDWLGCINVRGPILQMAALREPMRQRAAVLLTTSSTVYVDQAEGAVYAGSKGSLTAIVREWATDLAEDGISVTSIAPGITMSNFGEMPEDQKTEMRKKIASTIPLGRAAEPEEIAAVATFLLSPEASYVTGSQFVCAAG